MTGRANVGGVARRSSLSLMLGLSHAGSLLVLAPLAVLVTVPPVLDGIVAATLEHAGDVSPFLAVGGHHIVDDDALFGVDGFVVEIRPEILEVTFAALLGAARANGLGDPSPILGANLAYSPHERGVLLLRPRAPTVNHPGVGNTVAAGGFAIVVVLRAGRLVVVLEPGSLNRLL